MGTWNPGDPVKKRTMFYERIKRNGEEIVRFLPFYLVTYPGFSKTFEPVDCMGRRQNGCTVTNSSIVSMKEIHELREVPKISSLVNCEKKPDGTEITLHSFSWGWPR